MSRAGVVIPLYNHERYVVDAVESALAQGALVSRVIVVDDGSTDGSLAAVRGIADSRVRVISQPNAGAHAAINHGIAELEDDCEFAAVLNSDDLYRAGRIERCVAALDGAPSAALAVSALDMIDEEGNRLPPDHSRVNWYRATKSLLAMDLTMSERLGVANFAVTTSNFVGRRRWLREHPFRAYRYVHDYRSLIELAFADALLFLDEPLLSYRVHDTNTIDEDVRRLVGEVLAMNLDLAADHAEVLVGDRALRKRFCDYQRMAWSNISSYRQDTMQCLLAQLALAFDPERRRQLLERFDHDHFPEMSLSPNKRMVARGGTLDLPGETSGLAERLAASEAEKRRMKAAESRRKLLLRLHKSALRSRWLAIGRLLGVAPRLYRVDEQVEPGALASLSREAAGSRWLAAGALLGSRSCRRLLKELTNAPPPAGAADAAREPALRPAGVMSDDAHG